MKILVTGGSGVIGAGAIPALLQAGHEVRLLARHADRDARAFPDGVEPFVADICQGAELARAVEGCDVVLHIAGIVEEEPPEITFQNVNVAGTRNLLEAGTRAGGPFFIYVSSLGAPRGKSEYQKSKRHAEVLVREYSGPWLILRPGNVFGPGDETISMLLKMVRVLPAVPVVAQGDQPFQPLWYRDFGYALAQAVERRDLAGQELDLAGTEVTSTDDILRRLSAITGLDRPRLTMPVWLTEVGVQALEAFGAAGKRLLKKAGLGAPLSSATLTMLLEGSVLDDAARNALVTIFDVRPTPLDDALQILADMLPEQLPGEGVGALQQATYFADIVGASHNAASLLNLVCERIQDVMPLEFAAEPGTEKPAEPGVTLTAQIPGRGNVQVRLAERTEQRATFVTLEGHPLAGVVQLHTEDRPDGAVRFNVHTAAQPANVFDWLAMRAVGDTIQANNWRNVVRRVVDLSGGTSTENGIQRRSHTMDEVEMRDLRRYAERIVQRQQREMRAEAVAGGTATS
jgi:uncharacterized protein YbjT (DUF2867 family)